MELFLWIFLIVGITSVFSAPLIDNPMMAQQYLVHYNYLALSDMSGGAMQTEKAMKNGIKRFQRLFQINVTGEFDNDTMTMMNMPRCGVPDMMFHVDDVRKKRYSASQYTKWQNHALTYRIDSFTTDMTQTEVANIIKDALNHWAQVTALEFTRVYKPSKADILIDFTTFSHGDGNTFDGKGGILAHAFFPTSRTFAGDAHFDDSEFFVKADNGINLLQVAIHEFGHSLGLGHSGDMEAIMAPLYRGYIPGVTLRDDDIAGIRYLYGGKSSIGDVTMPTRSETMLPGGECSGKFDAVARTLDGNTYAFQGDIVYMLSTTGVPEGWPKPISSVFQGLPNDIDAAFYWPATLHTFFFKGNQFWKFTNTNKDFGYPRPITDIIGLPADIDAAFVWSGNGRAYFMKGDMYYRYDAPRNRIDSQYPQPLQLWRGLPLNKVDAAIAFDSRTYFFSGEHFYRFDDTNFEVETGYPQNTPQRWMGCTSLNLKGNGTAVLPSLIVLLLGLVNFIHT